MTNREYIMAKLKAFDISEAQLADLNIDLDAEYTPNSKAVGLALVSFLEELVLAPFRTNINENGFSVSWDTQNLGKYYYWLCKKYGVTPNEDITALIGMSVIKDRTDIW